MKTFFILVASAVCFSFLSCKKNSVASVSLTAKVGNDNYSFDSLYAWIDTSAAAFNMYYISIGGKDTKSGNYIYLQGYCSPANGLRVAGDYFVNPEPTNSLPASYKYFDGFATLNTGQATGHFIPATNAFSKLTVSGTGGSTIQGSFLLTLDRDTTGSDKAPQRIQMNGAFNNPLKLIP